MPRSKKKQAAPFSINYAPYGITLTEHNYIEERMNVVARYDTTFDRLHITPNNRDDFHICIDNVINEYVLWRYHTVGATAQKIMRVVKEEWLALLMRKENM